MVEMQPLNYNITPENPIGGYMQALQFGSALGGIGDAKRKEQMAAEAAEAARMDKAKKDAALQAAYIQVKENPSADSYVALSNLLPAEQAKSIREGFAMLTEDQQKSQLSESVNVWAALEAGAPEIAIDAMQKKAEAYKKDGNEEKAKETQMYVDLMKVGPAGVQTVKTMVGTITSMIPGGKEAMGSYLALRKDNREEDLHSLNKAKLQAEIDASEAKKKAGGITPEERFNQEEKLRKEYNSRVQNFTEMKQTYGNIKSSASDKSGAGDLALITGFMKMLDPGSVVRESEFASAQDTAGLMAKLNGSLTKIKNGEFLDDKQRKTFADLAGKYMDGAGLHNAKVKKDIGLIVKNYGLNDENVFGLPEEEVVRGAK